MAQLVTSPYVCQHAFILAALAREANRNNKDQNRKSAPWAKLREDYHSIISELSKPTAAGFSPWDILESHAVAQGLLWAMPDNADSLLWLANHLYAEFKNLPSYLRFIKFVAAKIGEESTIQLLPRICFLSLQTNEPTRVATHLTNRIAEDGAATYLVNSTPREFCEWAQVDAARVSKSLRERNTPLKDHPWLNLFDQYFDCFETVLDTDERLNLLMGLHGGYSFRMFKPMFTVFEEGDVQTSLGTDVSEQEEWKDLWVTVTKELVDGLTILQEPC